MRRGGRADRARWRARLLGAAVAVIAAAVAGSLAPPAASAAAGFSLPLVMHDRADGGYLATATISINGSDPIIVALDTGTSYLALNPGAIRNASTPPELSGLPFAMRYDGSGMDGEVARGTLSVLDAAGAPVATTPLPVAFIDGQTCISPGGCPEWGGRMQGVWGIGPGLWEAPEGDRSYDVYSPIMQFGGPSDEGFTIDFVSATPSIVLGPVAHAAAEDTVVDREPTGRMKPNGQRAFSDPPLCWTVSTGAAVASGCATTVIDSGQGMGMVSGPQFDAVAIPAAAPPLSGSGVVRTGLLTPGALVSWTVGPTGTPFAGVLSDGALPNVWGTYLTGDGDELSKFNTGAHFYRQHVVAYDNVSGRAIISPTPDRPAAPVLESVSPAANGLLARWREDAAPPDAWVVSVRDGAGTVVQRFFVPAVERTATITGLAPGGSWTVSVAGINAAGLGRWAAPVTTDLALAATGTRGVDALWGAALLIAGVVLVALTRRSRNPRSRGSVRS